MKQNCALGKSLWQLLENGREQGEIGGRSTKEEAIAIVQVRDTEGLDQSNCYVNVKKGDVCEGNISFGTNSLMLILTGERDPQRLPVFPFGFQG